MTSKTLMLTKNNSSYKKFEIANNKTNVQLFLIIFNRI